MLYVASDAPTLCPELRFWVDPPPVPVLGPPASCPVFLPSEQTPGPAQANWGLPAWGQDEGGGCAVLLVRLCHPALFVCAIIFVKIVLSVVATPLPPASGPICLPGLPHLTRLLWAFPASSRPCCQARPAGAHDSAACPKRWFLGVRGGVLLSRRSPGEGTLHDSPLPSFHQADGPVFPNQAALVHVPNGFSPHAPSPLRSQSSSSQAPECPFVHLLCPSVQ